MAYNSLSSREFQWPNERQSSMDTKQKRALPSWMVRNDNRDSADRYLESSKKEDVSKSATGNKIDEHIAYLEFHGKINYIYTIHECNFVCQCIVESSQKPITCGFDIEWRVSYKAGEGPRKTAVVQLCMSETECYIFHLSSMTGFPIALKSIIEDDGILKTGVGITGDISKISLEFKLNPSGIADLSVMLNEAKKISENWSLNGMVLHVLNKRLRKDPRIRCSNWEKYPLTEEQLQYAALDAYASWILHSKILMMRGLQSKSVEKS